MGCLLAVKDLNDKLGVMTASNAGYQKMTDSQTEKIRSLTTELEALRVSKVSELKASENEKRRLELKSDNLQKEIGSLIDDKAHMEYDRDEIKELMGRQKKDSDGISVRLRDQIAKISIERDTCQRQYDALFKLQQELTDATQKPAIAMSPVQTYIKSSTMQQVGLEQPRQLPKMSQSSSTSKGSSSIHAAPVGAEPPIFNPPQQQHPPGHHQDIVPLHQIKKEDVMEAPKVHFNNMDAQVDPVRHDHPGLQAPIYRDNHNVALDDDDLEDSADGQIAHDYQDDKDTNQRYDHLNDIDYDFQADFQQPKRVLPRQHQGFNQQPLIVHHDQHYRLAPQVARHQVLPNPYRRGL